MCNTLIFSCSVPRPDFANILWPSSSGQYPLYGCGARRRPHTSLPQHKTASKEKVDEQALRLCSAPVCRHCLLLFATAAGWSPSRVTAPTATGFPCISSLHFHGSAARRNPGTPPHFMSRQQRHWPLPSTNPFGCFTHLLGRGVRRKARSLHVLRPYLGVAPNFSMSRSRSLGSRISSSQGMPCSTKPQRRSAS